MQRFGKLEKDSALVGLTGDPVMDQRETVQPTQAKSKIDTEPKRSFGA